MTFNDDDIAAFMEKLTPEMFNLTTTCVDETPGEFSGAGSFDLMVEERLRGIRATFAQSYGRMGAVAVLSNVDIERLFVPTATENLGQFLERLKREAVLMGAHWMFIAKINTFGRIQRLENEDYPNLDSPQARARVTEQKQGVVWFAERREGGEVANRHGALVIEDGDPPRITKAIEGDERQSIGLFSLILDEVLRPS